MKFFISILFIITAPLFILLTALLYTPNINGDLKIALVSAGVYRRISDNIAHLGTDNTDWQPLYEYVIRTFTPDYIQKKTETALDTTTDWISGKTDTPPVLSFADIKQDLMTHNPMLLTNIETVLQQDSIQITNEHTTDNQLAKQQALSLQILSQLKSFLRSDFTIRLEKPLAGLRQSYRLVHILQPILLLLLCLYLFLFYYLNITWTARFVWVGMTLLVTGVTGLLIVYGANILINGIVTLILDNAGQTLLIISPFITMAVKLYITKYSYIQSFANISCIISATIFIVAALSVKVLGSILGISNSKKNYPLPQTLKMPKSNPFTKSKK